MFTYPSTADCVLPDGTSMLVSVSLIAGPGALDSITGTATSPDFLPSYLNAPEVILRLSDGRARKFLVTNVVGTMELKLVSNGDWLP
jgi:hypothetical protein